MTDNQCQASTLDWLRSLLLYPLPHHLASRAIGRLVRVRWVPFKNALIRLFSRVYGVDLAEAQYRRAGDYSDFNQFFTRALSDGARPLPGTDTAIACPADGTLSQIGAIQNGRIFQAKGRWYALAELLGSDELANPFHNGLFATIYLAPRDYHRVHMPVSGDLTGMCHVPGRLFSVAPHTTRAVPRLFTRNERVVTTFDTSHGPMALVLVGAVFVASIETAWHGVVTPPRGKNSRYWAYSQDQPGYARGAEVARFNMGSTAILIIGPGMAVWDAAQRPGMSVRMGQALGQLNSP